MYCTKCGTEIADGEQICPKCGNPIGNSVKDDAKHMDERKSHRGLIIGIAVAIVIVCIVVAIVLFLKSRSSSDDTSKNEVVEVESSESESDDVESSEPGVDEIESAETETLETGAAESDSESSADDTVLFSDLQIGSYVNFGKYEQDGDSANGQEPIEWEVLDIDGDRALLISKYVLDFVPYNEEKGEITWENCSLRKWLNSDFLNVAFTSNEQSYIQNTHLINDDNQKNGTYAGLDTDDFVFCLSVAEIYKYYTFDEWYGETVGGVSKDLVGVPTEWLRVRYNVDVNDLFWWLRSPSVSNKTAECASGKVYVGAGGFGQSVHYGTIGVRPALWVSLNGKATTVGAGESTDASDNGSVNPDDWELYRKVLDALVHNPELDDGLPTAYVYCSTQEVSYYYYNDTCYYKFYDIDGNGIDELFVSDGGIPIMYYIYDDGEPDYDYIFPNDSHFHYPLPIKHYNPKNHNVGTLDAEYAYSNGCWEVSATYDFYVDEGVLIEYLHDGGLTGSCLEKDIDALNEKIEFYYPMKGEEMFAYWYVLSPESIKDADSAIPVTMSENLPNALDSK